MPDTAPFYPSQKLVRCEVANRYQESSVRFVEIDAFRLWEYLMTHKHGLRIREPALCLWIGEQEYQHNANVFDRAGKVEAVSRIVVDLFDREFGFSQTITRYTRAAEAEHMLDILRSHIPPELRDDAACRIDVIAGRAVQKWHPHASRNILMGLEG